jgi:hypothetical protein
LQIKSEGAAGPSTFATNASGDINMESLEDDEEEEDDDMEEVS